MDKIENLKALRVTEDKRCVWNRTEIVTLKPFDEYRCIFVHIPRTGGTSVSKALFGNLSGSHISIAEYRSIFDNGEFEDYFKFSFVRNPWDRLVSTYQYLRAGGAQVNHDLKMQSKIQPYEDFGDFVRSWLLPSALEDGIHFLPQQTFISLDDENVPLDYIAHFETLHDDFYYIAGKLGLSASLPHLNASKRTQYKDYYDQETIEIVAELYRKDIELLGYDFDNSVFSR